MKKYEDDMKKIWENQVEVQDTMFYELCKKYADIALNSEKWRTKGTCEIQACFKNVDIDIAKEETEQYVKQWKIKEIDLFLELIYQMHFKAVEWDDGRCTGGKVMPENYDWRQETVARYYNFSMLPKSVWSDIQKEIKEHLT